VRTDPFYQTPLSTNHAAQGSQDVGLGGTSGGGKGPQSGGGTQGGSGVGAGGPPGDLPRGSPPGDPPRGSPPGGPPMGPGIPPGDPPAGSPGGIPWGDPQKAFWPRPWFGATACGNRNSLLSLLGTFSSVFNTAVSVRACFHHFGLPRSFLASACSSPSLCRPHLSAPRRRGSEAPISSFFLRRWHVSEKAQRLWR
jgi:hypothetical protein